MMMMMMTTATTTTKKKMHLHGILNERKLNDIRMN